LPRRPRSSRSFFTPAYSLGGAPGSLWSLVICFVPRILIGVTAGLLFRLFSPAFERLDKKKVLACALSAVGGTWQIPCWCSPASTFYSERVPQAIGVSFNLLLASSAGPS
jgi:uncharacterized membrane protein